MAFNDVYLRQVNLLLRAIPFIAREDSFALKGGTAINLFVRDLPRLSVDIDLTYLPVLNRSRSLGAIDKAMKRVGERVEKGIRGSRITTSASEGAVTKLFIREQGVQITVEVTPVLRGCAYEPELRSVSPSVEDRFGFAEIQVLSFPDLYAGKIVAALDRQHPRDLFDVRALLANEGISEELRAAFIVYLLSHTRPMAEVLAARPKDIASAFALSMAPSGGSHGQVLYAHGALRTGLVRTNAAPRKEIRPVGCRTGQSVPGRECPGTAQGILEQEERRPQSPAPAAAAARSRSVRSHQLWQGLLLSPRALQRRLAGATRACV